MANKNLFGTPKATTKKADIINQAGGIAHSFESAHALCQYVVTGTFQNTYYTNAQQQLDAITALVKEVEPELIAKAAVYGRQKGKMKDMPAYLLAVLAGRNELELLEAAWPKVINNTKMLLNFCQIIRSGVTGRKSFGSCVKHLIQEWLTSRNCDVLLQGSFGHSSPSLGDVIKMVHPKPVSRVQDATFAYIAKRALKEGQPHCISQFENFKKGLDINVPNLPFMALSSCDMTDEQWKTVARNMPWNTLRMNLNQLQRHNVFNDNDLMVEIAHKLSDPEEVRKWNAFPYQLLTTYQNIDNNIPVQISNAIQNALEVATENVPVFNCNGVAVCPDLSGSMGNPVTGNSSRPTKTTCYDVAGLFSTTILRHNPSSKIIAWASDAKEVRLNTLDSIATNTHLLTRTNVGHATNASLALSLLNKQGWKGELVIYVSDNQSWIRQPIFRNYANELTGMQNEWNIFKKRNRRAKLVCIDIQPYANTQIPDNNDILNIGGFNDSVFDTIKKFVDHDKTSFVDTVRQVNI